MKNSADLGGCYPPQPSASVDNTLLDHQNSSYPTQPHSMIANYLQTDNNFCQYWLSVLLDSYWPYCDSMSAMIFPDCFMSCNRIEHNFSNNALVTCVEFCTSMLLCIVHKHHFYSTTSYWHSALVYKFKHSRMLLPIQVFNFLGSTLYSIVFCKRIVLYLLSLARAWLVWKQFRRDQLQTTDIL